MSYHLTSVRMAVINKSINKYWRGCGEKGNLLELSGGMQIGAATLENSIESLQKIKNETALYDPMNLLLGICPKKTKTLILKNICTPMFTAALFTTAKLWKQPKCPSVDQWIKQLWYIYNMEYYLAIKNEILPLATAWIDLEGNYAK